MKENRPSLTSLCMANLILVLGGSTKSSRLLAPGCLESQIELLAACGLPFGGPVASKMICNPFVSTVTRHFADIVVQPQALDCLGFRKTWIEQQVRQSLHMQLPMLPAGEQQTPHTTSRSNQQRKEGGDTTPARAMRQLLVVGAGYDTLALRLANEYNYTHGRYRQVGLEKKSNVTTFWEVDHPSTGRVKERGLRRLLQSPDSVRSIHLDLTQHKLSDILPTTSGYDCTAPTIVVLEGLTYYLQEDVLYNLFQDIAKVVGPRSRIVFDFFVTSSNDGRPEICTSSFLNGRFLDLVQLVGEPLYFSCGQRHYDDPSPTTTRILPKNTRTSARRRRRRRADHSAAVVDDSVVDDEYTLSIVKDLAVFFKEEKHERQGTPYWKVVTPVQAVGFERLVVVELTQPRS